MSPRPRLKSQPPTPDQARPAEPARTTVASSAPKVAAEGVPSAVGPDAHAPDGRRPIAWLHIVTPSDWQIPPRANSRCECGRNLTAKGRARVLALIDDHTAHREVCPLRNPVAERRQAA
jgi:hypothetical protein